MRFPAVVEDTFALVPYLHMITTQYYDLQKIHGTAFWQISSTFQRNFDKEDVALGIAQRTTP